MSMAAPITFRLTLSFNQNVNIAALDCFVGGIPRNPHHIIGSANSSTPQAGRSRIVFTSSRLMGTAPFLSSQGTIISFGLINHIFENNVSCNFTVS